MHATRSRAARIAWLAAPFGALVGACSFFIDSELGTVRCSAEGAYGPPACPGGHACVAGLCTPAPRPDPELGSPCSTDADCAGGDLCLDPARFGASGPASCSRTCCTSGDCDSSAPGSDAATDTRFVCWVPELGGGAFCRLALDHGRPEPGMLAAGEACDEGADCRSGLCERGRCLDSCCTDAGCALTGAVCRMLDEAASEGAAWSCVEKAAAPKGYLEPCASDGDCSSGLCLNLGGELRCSQPCCGSASCGMLDTAELSAKIACAHVPRHGSLVRACAVLLPNGGDLAVGAPCTADLECRSGRCAGGTKGGGSAGAGGEASGVCTDVCCVDADCGSSAIGCRPVEHGLGWALGCVAL